MCYQVDLPDAISHIFTEIRKDLPLISPLSPYPQNYNNQIRIHGII